MTAGHVQCRYLRRNDEQCTAEALDSSPDARVVLCLKHAARVMQLITEHQQTSTHRRSA